MRFEQLEKERKFINKEIKKEEKTVLPKRDYVRLISLRTQMQELNNRLAVIQQDEKLKKKLK